MNGNKIAYRKIIVEFKLKDNLGIPPEAESTMRELFEGMAKLFSDNLAKSPKFKIPTKYNVKFE